ncbi:peroxiredoxin family protein [Marinifilum sp.]|uniref:peroxiredoxin family protein n=1 Tax=Marinifilum sp. TaxID=2033137 RepID=UPI003BAA02DD
MKMTLNRISILLLLGSAIILLYRFGNLILPEKTESNFSLEIKLIGQAPKPQSKWYFLANDEKGNLKPVLFSKEKQRDGFISFFEFKNGSAKIQEHISRLGLYVLTNQERTCYFPFMLDASRQSIELVSDSLLKRKDLLTPIPFSFSGSTVNQEFINFWKTEEAEQLLQADANYLQWLQNNKPSKQSSREHIQQFVEEQKEQLTLLNLLKESVALSYLEKNPNSYLALDYFLAYVFRPNFAKLDESDMKYYTSLLGDKLKKTQEYKSIAQKYKATQNFCIGKTPPAIELPDSRGNQLTLSDFTGNVTLVNFWVINCDYCKAEQNNMLDLYAKYHEQDFEIVSIALDANKKNWQSYINEKGFPWQQAIDTTGSEHSQIIIDYWGMAIPSSYLIDKEGKVIAKNLRCPAYADEAKYNMNQQLEKVFGF